MSRSGVRWIPVAIALALAGCQQQGVRSGPEGTTGQLGSPVARQSPADIYIELSAAYLQEKRFDEAFRNAQKAVIVDPSSSNAYYMLALVQQSLGQQSAADQAFARSIALDSHNPNARNAYGSFLCSRGQMDEADAQFRQALSNPLYATPWTSWHNAGACHETAGDTQAAERDYRAALQVNPRFAPSLLGMARLSLANDNPLSARAYLQRYAEVAEHTAESLWLGVRTENQLGDHDQMATYSLKLRAKFPDSDEAGYLKSIE
ncbi:MAG: type IV pilus biogenesis/stability protein PilW [Gammaproteobacteria bacterium]|nr:type IV pilus biogenesis/stability protein PilW [Gammaproteobacteria bacterium]